MTTTTSGASPEITYFNALNQKVKEQHTGFDGRKIISDTYYDDLGRIKQAFLLTIPLPVIVLLVLLPKLSYL
jgi:hypothetical protein